MKTLMMTMVFNDDFNLNLWYSFYSRQIGGENILLLDHGSDKEYKSRYPSINTINLGRSHFSDIERCQRISDLQNFLIREYDAVIYTDCDELLIPDPKKFSGLSEYLAHCARSDRASFSATGLNVFHSLKREGPIDVRKSIFSQRSFCYFHSIYCKPLITKAAVRWNVGFHSSSLPSLVDPDLYLFHLRDMDHDFSISRLSTTRSLNWGVEEVAAGLGSHQRFSDEQAVEERFLQPDRWLDQATDLSFDFSSAVASVNSSFSDFKGPVAKIPAVFVGYV